MMNKQMMISCCLCWNEEYILVQQEVEIDFLMTWFQERRAVRLLFSLSCCCWASKFPSVTLGFQRDSAIESSCASLFWREKTTWKDRLDSLTQLSVSLDSRSNRETAKERSETDKNKNLDKVWTKQGEKKQWKESKEESIDQSSVYAVYLRVNNRKRCIKKRKKTLRHVSHPRCHFSSLLKRDITRSRSSLETPQQQ